MALLEDIKELSAKYYDDVIKLRRQIHANPELAFEEKETAALVAKTLRENGIEAQEGIAKTGVVGIIKGKNADSKVKALRADMDALPILEENDVPYKSKIDGKMHACGHDVHTSSLLGTAMILNEVKDQFEGTVKLIFQPSEERAPGGARVMIDEGVLQNPSPINIIGQHVTPDIEIGKVGFCAGPAMASADEIYITVHGKGGHAAAPHKCIDPILIASHIIVSLQQAISRNCNPLVPSVLSFGYFNGNGFTNVIPNKVEIKGTFRTFDEKWRVEALKIVRKMATGIAESMGATCDVHMPDGYPFLRNHEDLTIKTREQTALYIGEENAIEIPPRMSGEDFAFYSHHVPACFYRLGTGNKSKGITSSVHTPTFDIDEDVMELSTGLMAWLAVN